MPRGARRDLPPWQAASIGSRSCPDSGWVYVHEKVNQVPYRYRIACCSTRTGRPRPTEVWNGRPQATESSRPAPSWMESEKLTWV